MKKPDISAGKFSSWHDDTLTTQLEFSGSDVPCGTCTACCTSSYFIHIKPEEVKTLARIPQELCFAAPGLPQGNVVMGYDQEGHCPMLINNKCSIYEDRPQTCRNYDCRIFPATGISLTEQDKVLINQQATRWRFTLEDQEDQNRQAAVKRAARFLQECNQHFKAHELPRNETQLAIVAIKVYELFLEDLTGVSDHEIARRIIRTRDEFEERSKE